MFETDGGGNGNLKDIYCLAQTPYVEGEIGYYEKTSATRWMLRIDKPATLHVYPGSLAAWQDVQRETHFSHWQYITVVEMTQEEYDEIIERYHIHYDD